MSNLKVGFVGLGIMGSRMARNLALKGFEVVVWNRTRQRADALVKDGATVAPTPRQLASGVDVFCTCVADPAALESVVHGPDGLFAGSRKGQLFIDFSTISPDLSRTLETQARERGLSFVEAPVTGSKGGAEKGTLVVMAGGSEEAMAQARPVFEAVSEKVIHCGPVPAGSQVKLAGNALIAAMLQAFSEGLLLTKKAGVDPRKLIEVVQASGFRSPYFDFKGQQILGRDFATHFSIDLMFKDLRLFLDSAAQHHVPTPAAAGVAQAYVTARAAGKGDQDIAAVVTAYEELCQTRIG
ncbi:MAG: NAD(P)-dependent oxidoreductase [Myxococcota bacterium]|nr:NAD(P)-dependent oxidoreductase [Myxococcota bacterium]